MKIQCLQEDLKRGLGIVGKGVGSRSTLPVLSNVLLSADTNGLNISATNLEIGVRCSVNAKIEVEGAITIPYKLLSDFVNSLPPERIDLDMDEDSQSVTIKCAHFEATLKGIDAQEFPEITVLDGSNDKDVIYLDAKQLNKVINLVTIASATEETRPVLTGVLCEFKEGTLTMSAADGFRLSLKHIQLSLDVDEPFSVIIPSRTLSEVRAVMGTQYEPVSFAISPNKNKALFHIEGVDMTSQLLEGTYPNIKAIIPEQYHTKTILDAKKLLRAIRLSYIFVKNNNGIVTLDIAPDDGKVIVTSASSDGDNTSELDARIEGEAIKIAFNAKYIIDILAVLDSSQVAIETTASASPGVFKSIGDDEFIYVIMPMHLLG